MMLPRKNHHHHHHHSHKASTNSTPALLPDSEAVTVPVFECHNWTLLSEWCEWYILSTTYIATLQCRDDIQTICRNSINTRFVSSQKPSKYDLSVTTRLWQLTFSVSYLCSRKLYEFENDRDGIKKITYSLYHGDTIFHDGRYVFFFLISFQISLRVVAATITTLLFFDYFFNTFM